MLQQCFEASTAVPTGRLMVLGEPGAGKTMLMVGLVLDLLHPSRRTSSSPVPVLTSLASWDPGEQDLHTWLGATLITEYPDLAEPPPPKSVGNNRIEALVEAGLILPVLDGLDEIADSVRPEAITRIDEELRPGEQMVITCRTEQYRAAVCPQDAQGIGIRAAAVQLSSLEISEVTGYLRTDAGPAAGRWDFLDTLSAWSPVRQALATPLAASLARAIYNTRPSKGGRDLPDPDELCHFASRAAVEAHLFDAFIPAAYRSSAGGRWTAKQAETWLVFLACHLERTIRSPDLAWWQLQEALPRTTSRFVVKSMTGITAGLLVGLPAVYRLGLGLWLGLGIGLGIGLGLGIVAGLGIGIAAGRWAALSKPKTPIRSMRMGIFRHKILLTVFITYGAVFAVGYAAWTGKGIWVNLILGMVFGLWFGICVVTAITSAAVPDDFVGVTSPLLVLARDRRATLLILTVGPFALFIFMFGLVYGVLTGSVAGLWAEHMFGIGPARWIALTTMIAAIIAAIIWLGIVSALLAGLLGMVDMAWPSFLLARAWLALHHRLPWPLMTFLADAQRRGVLRQAGAVYQFRHIELQHRLANRP